MGAKRVADGVWEIGLRQVNAFYLDAAEGGVLIDTGFPGHEGWILSALKEIGKGPGDVKHIVLTHGHPDHIGSAAALQRATGAKVWVHGADAEIVRTGRGFRPLTAGPGIFRKLMIAVIKRQIKPVEGTVVDELLEDGQVLPFAGGLRVIHAPGHCAGQVALLSPHEGGVLFAADACMNVITLGLTVGYEDQALGERSLRRLAKEEFAMACFGHGKTIASGAAERFRQKWPEGGSA